MDVTANYCKSVFAFFTIIGVVIEWKEYGVMKRRVGYGEKKNYSFCGGYIYSVGGE